MSIEKFDKIGYEFTLASGDKDWSDCNFYGEKNGKKTWLGNLNTETKINGSDEWWDYDDIEDFARKAVTANEMYKFLKQLKEELDLYLSDSFDAEQLWSLMNGKMVVLQELLQKARGEE